ncbi:MAG: GNAT family N-acetyltransferase [Lachnospiraceae bacterium]|nr:GNAT family N-acetyltransferase [Lachnospiraceae bacterium]
MAEWTQQKILSMAMEQSAIDLCCQPEDFLKNENVIVTSAVSENCRKYLKLPFFCNLVSYGNNLVASLDPKVQKVVCDYMERYGKVHAFETPNMHVLDDAFRQYGYRICFMAEYFLPELSALKPSTCDYELRILNPEDFEELYVEQWSNALCKDRKQLDVLGVGAYDDGKLIGLAGCSADGREMWQIGIDVRKEYRRQGLAVSLTSHLALEILKRDKVPFYCAAWSNIPSVRNAIKSGFRPAWVEMTAKEETYVNEMNGVGR